MVPADAPGVLVAGAGAPREQIEAFADGGGTVVYLPQPAAALAASGLPTQEVTLYKAAPVEHPLLAGVGPRLLRWRDGLKAVVPAAGATPEGWQVLGGGLFIHQPRGKGEILLVQADPRSLAERYPEDAARRKAVWPSVERLQQLYARILTNAGARPSEALARRVCTLRAGATYETLSNWQVCGPFAFPGLPMPEVIGQATPAEADAVKGDPHPDLRYFTPEGAERNWRRTVTASEEGFVNLGEALGVDHQALAYVTRKVMSASDRTARLRLGVDFFLQVYVNGELVYDLSRGGGTAPKPNTHQVDVRLKKGANAITLKVAAGSKGFGFWADLSAEGADPAGTDAAEPGVDLYPVSDRSWDPYSFYYY